MCRAEGSQADALPRCERALTVNVGSATVVLQEGEHAVSVQCKAEVACTLPIQGVGTPQEQSRAPSEAS